MLASLRVPVHDRDEVWDVVREDGALEASRGGEYGLVIRTQQAKVPDVADVVAALA